MERIEYYFQAMAWECYEFSYEGETYYFYFHGDRWDCHESVEDGYYTVYEGVVKDKNGVEVPFLTEKVQKSEIVFYARHIPY